MGGASHGTRPGPRLDWQRECNDGDGQIVTMRCAIVRFASDSSQISPRREKNLSKAPLGGWAIVTDPFRLLPEITLWSHFSGE
jgi:hypothetical protein